MMYYTTTASPLGEIILSSTGEKLNGLWFSGQKYERELLKKADAIEENQDLPIFCETRRWLAIYFSGREPDFMPELELSGTPFRQRISRIMLSIPYGHTMTYGTIAREAAREMGRDKLSAQAVGGAVGHNPISILVPCHRVVGANGSLTGYAGGIQRKIRLLENEHFDLAAAGLRIPRKGTAL
ncbi:MAG: methylated-DNA--[protein]-cysteine S-methyltransferase [Eubacteriales bacterium]